MQPAERAALIARLSLEERAALVAEIEAANISEAIAEALSRVVDAVPHAGARSATVAASAVMNPEEAAAYAGIGVNAMRDLLRTGAIAHRRRGRNYLVRREALDEWMRCEEEAERRRHAKLMGRGA